MIGFNRLMLNVYQSNIKNQSEKPLILLRFFRGFLTKNSHKTHK